ncbi:MAG TPA: glucoamylase family protein [Steroidobacteraceae bacterium]|nr:glucoamylase family protein [Steroidobacteraceae bacterium]
MPKAQTGSMDDALAGSALAGLSENELLDAVQRRTFRFFWEGAQPDSGMARDRIPVGPADREDLVVTGGTGFGVMALIVAVERGWVTRDEALARLRVMLDVLYRATCYHGVFAHFINGRTAATIPFWRKDDGGDLVETSFLMMGLLCARRYFDRDTALERDVRGRISGLWEEVEWTWYTQGGRKLLYWHWSPNNGWAMDHEIHGWNECLITYVLAAAAPRYAINPNVYHRGFAAGRDFVNGRSYYDIPLTLGGPYGGPLFFTHYSFCGLDPRGLKDRYADYWEQNVSHVRINYAHCQANPGKFRGYGPGCWGLTASDDPDGYSAHAPDNDNGTIAPTAALSSMPYAPAESLRALRHFLTLQDGRLWSRYGFVDAFCEQRDWRAETFLAIDQGPIMVMIENYRTGLLWKLFMSDPDVQTGLRRLDFTSPWLGGAERR